MLTRSGKKIQDVLSFDSEMFVELKAQDHITFHFFDANHIDMIKHKIAQSESAEASTRTGGKQLASALESFEVSKERMLNALDKIKGILQPKEKHNPMGIAIANALQAERLNMFHVNKAIYANMDEKPLRILAAAFIGEKEYEYTKDELVDVLALKQAGLG